MNSGVQNRQLHDALRAWLQAVLPLLTKRAWYAMPESRWDLYAELMLGIGDTPAHRVKEARTLLDIIARIPEFVGNTSSESRTNTQDTDETDYTAEQIISDFVHEYLLESRDTDFDSKTFSVTYLKLENYLYRFDYIPIRTTIELWNVQSEVPHISLPPDITIRPLTEEEGFQSQVSAAASLRFGNVEHIWTPELLIEIERFGRDFAYGSKLKRSSVRFGSLSQAREVGDRVLTGLRLINDGVIWLGFTSSIPGNPFLDPAPAYDITEPSFWIEPLSDPVWVDPPLGAHGPPYVINDAVAGKLASLWPILSPPLKDQQLELPLRRFQTSFDRKIVTDRFIDHWIALEALFSSNESEVTYKMSQRIAQFVGADAQERWDIFCQAKKSYGARSAVVHGRMFKPEYLLTHAQPTEDFLRRSLIKCLESEQMPDHAALERQMFLQDSATGTE